MTDLPIEEPDVFPRRDMNGGRRHIIGTVDIIVLVD